MNPVYKTIFFIIFFLVIIVIQFFVYKTFRKFLLRKQLNVILVNYISRVPFIFFLLPFVFFVITKYDFAQLPHWVNQYLILPFYIFQGAIIFIGFYLLIGKIIKFPFVLLKFIINRIEIVRKKYEKIRDKKVFAKFDESRRKFLTTSTTAVAGYAFLGASIGAISKDDYDIVEQKIKIRNINDELRKLNIILISDIHSGPFMDVSKMKEYVQVINSLNPDLVFIPGDLTNSRKEEISPFVNAFREINAKYGTYATLGNHDYFDNSDYISDAVNSDTPFNLLRNKSQLIKIGNSELCILGIDDTRDSGNNSNPILKNYISDTIKQYEVNNGNQNISSIPKILLCHKPYVFDDVSDQNFDLMLSGHTHGGQVVFLKFGDFNLSFASSVNKYISGLYVNNNKSLYVSRGIGTVGLPIRFNCPPEITKIQLV